MNIGTEKNKLYTKVYFSCVTNILILNMPLGSTVLKNIKCHTNDVTVGGGEYLMNNRIKLKSFF